MRDLEGNGVRSEFVEQAVGEMLGIGPVGRGGIERGIDGVGESIRIVG